MKLTELNKLRIVLRYLENHPLKLVKDMPPLFILDDELVYELDSNNFCEYNISVTELLKIINALPDKQVFQLYTEFHNPK